MSAQETEADPRPPIVVKGHLTASELAALTAVVAVLRRERDRPHTPSTSTLAGGWKSYWHTVRNPLVPGSEAWRSSFRL
ncbi:acyl-CoA carboxylase subunit epsilon [Propionicicella superfundia]|uniref:acyl-CoA carboxylase subunit epsilon n=1 Tax=Propionicicella superfundia TaxID=348582 RepID=UPI00041CCD95|nr:acyl-CoA carboxylase subunit epsilon [Propionicicella superfundia]